MNENQNTAAANVFAAQDTNAQQLVSSKVFNPALGLMMALCCVAFALPSGTLGLAARLGILIPATLVAVAMIWMRSKAILSTTLHSQRGSSAFLVSGYLIAMVACLLSAMFLQTNTGADALFIGMLAFVTTVLLGRHYDETVAEQR